VSQPPERVWRVFPWDPRARAGEPFSADHVPAGQGAGRFDLRGRLAGVLYSAETPEHAIAEQIQHFRGQVLEDRDLVAAGHRLALVPIALPADLSARVADLCDPKLLVRLRVGPDATASRHRATTQEIAGAVHTRGHAGLRWWSAFFGDWHVVVLFRDRIAVPLEYGAPEPLSLRHEGLRDAARQLGLALARA
jgi:hypothetical protein